MTKSVLISAGEVSGDIHSAELIRSLKNINPNLSFFGIGGAKMEAEGVKLLERAENLSVVGVWEILSKLSHIRSAYKKIVESVRTNPPDAAILVDYPGFNLNLARRLKEKGVPVVYYITPQVWAWGKWRMRVIKKYVDKALVILKFEEALFKKYGIDATFVGHPVLDGEKKISGNKISRGLDEKKRTIALLPGSRDSEVKKMLPLMLETARLITKELDAQFLLLKCASVHEKLYEKILEGSPVPVSQIKDDTYTCLSLADFIFTSSGTATLESAIMERPMLITYKTSLLTALFFKVFSRTPFIGLVNIIAGKEVAPEILQYDARPERLAKEILSIISSREKLEVQLQGIREVKRELGSSGAAERAAGIIEGVITRRR